MREELGLHAWNLLHTIAAYYPDAPTEDERAAAAGLVHAVAALYPCKHCRAAFQLDIHEHPPRLDTREAFSLWLCGAHNRVNRVLGKPVFPCSVAALDERWRTGRRECWAGAPQTAVESLGQADDEAQEETAPAA